MSTRLPEQTPNNQSGYAFHEKLKARLNQNQIPFTEQKEDNAVIVYIHKKQETFTNKSITRSLFS